MTRLFYFDNNHRFKEQKHSGVLYSVNETIGQFNITLMKFHPGGDEGKIKNQRHLSSIG